MSADESYADERVELARACRLMSYRGLADDILGHISRRVDGDRLLVRCRGPAERGLRFTVPDDIHVVDLDGRLDGSTVLSDGYRPPVPISTR